MRHNTQNKYIANNHKLLVTEQNGDGCVHFVVCMSTDWEQPPSSTTTYTEGEWIQPYTNVI